MKSCKSLRISVMFENLGYVCRGVCEACMPGMLYVRMVGIAFPQKKKSVHPWLSYVRTAVSTYSTESSLGCFDWLEV